MPLVTREELAEYARIPDGADDPALDVSAASASQAVAEWCHRTFDKDDAVSARVFVPCDDGYVRTDDFYTTTGLIVKTDTGDDGTFATTWTISTDFLLQPDNGRLHGQQWPYHALVGVNGLLFPTWTRRRPSVQVTAAWGWETYPDAVKQAGLIWAHRLFKRRMSPEGVLSGFADYGIARVNRMDPDVQSVTGLLAPFVRYPKLVA
jgi:hypothetical protein